MKRRSVPRVVLVTRATEYEELVAKGVTISVEPKDFRDVRVAFFLDPDGNSIELMEDPRVA